MSLHSVTMTWHKIVITMLRISKNLLTIIQRCICTYCYFIYCWLRAIYEDRYTLRYS
jgi:hypothetical protein